MKIIIAPDSFKGSLTSRQVCDAIEKGVKKADAALETMIIPMADGGEGTVEALMDSLGGSKVSVWVNGPLFRKIKAEYGLLGDGKTAVMEMAAASGLALLSQNERNPMKTTTFGTGELIKDALDRGCRNFIIGIGGSATNDGGIGMAAALGVKFYDEAKNLVDLTGSGLLSLDSIDLSQLDPRVKDSVFDIFCDVDNPLYGPKGAARVYGRQKGADDEMIEQLDKGLHRLLKIIEKDLKINVASIPGGGAAGGLGAGLVAFLNAKLQKGVDILMRSINFEERIKDADLIITGEGRMDEQTKYGKTAFGILKAAKKYEIPVVGICGSIGPGVEELYAEGLYSVFSIVNRPMTLEECMAKTPELLSAAAENVTRLFMVQPNNMK